MIKDISIKKISGSTTLALGLHGEIIVDLDFYIAKEYGNITVQVYEQDIYKLSETLRTEAKQILINHFNTK